MAKRNRTITIQPPKVEGPMVIHIDPWRLSLGHQGRCCGTGVHQDRRQRRQRTRSAQLQAALRD